MTLQLKINDTVKNSSITTKHLYLILTFRSHHGIIRYKCLVVIDEFLTVSLYQPNEFISWKTMTSCF